ncbi:hypothetical protein [Isoptericola sp. NPDC056605]|uniref:hypothetical protein n=1 Tax=Isoptericola sp. NPDC056605 TaxID=3345876 RepID=UPI0036A4DA71
MNAAVQEIEREVHELTDRIRNEGRFATRAEKQQLRQMRARLVLARKGVVR